MITDTLNNLKLGEKAIVDDIFIETKNKQNIINLGISKDTEIKCLYRSPLGDPSAYLIKNVIIAIRNEDAKYIKIIKENNGTY